MSTNEELQDAITRHQVFLQRYAKGREEMAAMYIDDLIEQTRSRLTFDITPTSRTRAERLMLDLKVLHAQLTQDFSDETFDEMRRLYTQEVDFNAEILGQNVRASFALPSPNQIEAALSTNIMQLEPTKGYTIRSALSEFGSRKSQQIVQIIRDATVLGDTTQAIIQSITALGGVQRRQASTLARTITNHVATNARTLTMKENDDVLDGYKWVSTLDGRTSLICAARDGKIYPVSDESPKPPAHFNCRSTITFAVKPEYSLLAGEEGTRASMDGPVDRNLTFGDWLKRQSPEFQDQVLGKERAQLFRTGRVPIDRFVDEQGRTLSLDQLRRMDEDFNGLAPIPVPAAAPQRPTFRMRPAEEITFKTPAEARKAISDRFAAAEVDPRYEPDRFRFRGRRKNYAGRATALKNTPAEIVQAFDAVHPELDELATLFNIPGLRGLARIRANSRAGADMGDGIMGINAKWQGARVKDLGASLTDTEQVAEWASDFAETGWGEARKGRPWTAGNYHSKQFDRFRSTMYHEMGHHVHQMYNVKPGEFMSSGYGWTPQVERIIEGYKKTDRKSPSVYGDSNEAEWFAENFCLYFMDKRDKVDPLFRDLIEELIDGAYN